MAPEAGRALLEAAEELRRKEGFPLVIAEHRLWQVRPHVNRVLVMREGRIVGDTRLMERIGWRGTMPTCGEYEDDDGKHGSRADSDHRG